MGLIYPILRKLKIDLKRKLTLFGLLSLGMFSLLCNVARTVVMLEPPFTGTYYWATAEISIAIICASIPTIRPLFDKRVWMSRSSAEPSGAPHSNATSRKTSKPWINTVDSDTITLKSVPSTRWETKHERDDVESYREEVVGKAIE
jgi:hypothetical protein